MKFRMIKVDLRHRTVHECCHIFQIFVVNCLEGTTLKLGFWDDNGNIQSLEFKREFTRNKPHNFLDLNDFKSSGRTAAFIVSY
jgi:hypothetical protein